MVTEATRLRERGDASGRDAGNINASAPRVAAAKDSLAAHLAASRGAARSAHEHMRRHDLLGLRPLEGLNLDGGINYVEHIYSLTTLLASGWIKSDDVCRPAQVVNSIHGNALDAIATLAALAHYSLVCEGNAAECAL